MIIWDKFKDSFKILRNSYKLLWIGIITEILFFIVWGFLSSPFIVAMETNLVYLGDEVISSNSPDIAGIMSQSGYLNKIIFLGVMLLLISFLMYVVFHGFLWKFSFNLKDKKKGYFNYIKKFLLVNLFWLPFFIIYFLINFLFSYMDIVAKRFNPEGLFIFGQVTNIILLIILYFAFLSYVLIDKNKIWTSIKKSFAIGFRKSILLMYILMAAVFVIMNLILTQLPQSLVIILGVIVIVPFMILSRVFIREVIQN